MTTQTTFNAYDFIISGSEHDDHKGCCLTVVKPNRSHHTYKFRWVQPSENYHYRSCFVSVMTGTDNENHFSYIGLLNSFTGGLKTTRGSKLAADDVRVVIIDRVLSRLCANEQHIIESHGWELKHEGKCGRCGRKLTNPESIETGIGPVCSK